MFKLDCMVDDKKLVAVMKALAGNVYNLNATPVKNLESNSRRKALNPEGTDAASLLFQVIKAIGESGKQTVSTIELADTAKKRYNLAYQTVMYGVKVMLSRGVITRSHRGVYNINHNKL